MKLKFFLKTLYNLLIIYILFIQTLNLFPIEPLLLPEKLTFIPIAENIEYLEDKTKTLEFEDMRQISSNWLVSKNKGLHFGFSNSVFWLRFTVQNPNLKKINFIFDTGNSRLDSVEFFYPEEGGNYKSILTGDLFSYSKRDVDNSNFAFNIELNPLESKIFYVRLSSSNNVSNLDPSLQSSSYLEKHTRHQILINGIFYGFMIIMLFYNLSLYFAVKEKAYLLFCFYVFFQLFYFLGGDGTAFQYIYPNSPWLQNRNSSFSTILTLIFSTLFINSFLELKSKMPKAFTINRFLIGILSVLLILNPFYLMEFFPKIAFYVTNFFILLGLGLAIFYSSYLALKKFRPAYFYLAAWLLFLLTALLRLFAVISVIPGNLVTLNSVQIGVPINLILLSLGLADRINHFKNQLQESNEKLEDKVIERTAELNESLMQITLLKEKQDGDYFLTSLLIKPLSVNKANKENVIVEFFIKQKKEFQFRERGKLDIGGDICIAHTMSLRERIYTVFLNADAMGKSLQGASGALIIGSLFGSIVNRVKFSKAQQALSPERWMKNTFIEMYKIFEVFDFSMMASVAFGVIEEETGLLYYINADHPFTVLLRNGNVRFIDSNPMFTKLGMIGGNNHFYIQTFPLQKGDILIAGSDGREDIMDNATGDIQWDENFFLDHVKNANANLELIYNSISESGKIIDDFSLLKITYNGNIFPIPEIQSPIVLDLLAQSKKELQLKKYGSALEHLFEALEIKKNHPLVQRKISFAYFQKKDYENALQFALSYLEKKPEDISILYLSSKCLARLRRFEEAIDFSERIRLRNPFLKNNLIHLYALLMITRNLTRAQKILEKFKKK